MNTAYSEELRPPKELFSRTWYDPIGFGGIMLRDDLYSRINETKKKLEDLEIRLREKFWGNNSGLYHEYLIQLQTVNLLVDTVAHLNSHIGVWTVTILYTSPSKTSHITMEYPHNRRVMSKWEEDVLGGVKREGVCLTMLSPESVHWLNTISDWVRE